MTRARWTGLSGLIAAIAIVVGAGLYLTQHGVSARAEPLRAEEERQFLNGTEPASPNAPDAKKHEHHQE